MRFEFRGREMEHGKEGYGMGRKAKVEWHEGKQWLKGR
jgi:hypothetical protein